MTRLLSASLVCAVALLFVPEILAQTVASPVTAACNFDANNQLAVEYVPMTVDVKKPVFGHEVPYNHAWAPGGRPMTVFINHPVTLGGKDLPIGAYTMFVIPSEKQWTLVISRSTDTSGKYDEHADLARVPMDRGELSNPETSFSVYFAHIAPNQCSMRLDLGKERAWVVFEEKK